MGDQVTNKPRPTSAGARFRDAVLAEKPLQIVGASNAYLARMAERVGFKALYLSGGALSAGSLGLPDLGISNLADVLTDVQRITYACDLPLLVDADTGFGPNALNMERTVKSLIKNGAAAMHIEDQIAAKRSSSRGKLALVSVGEMQDRIKAAIDARTDADFVVMARTDAMGVDGFQAALDRACAYAEAGADMLIPEALTDLAMYKTVAAQTGVPILAGLPERGATPMFTVDQLRAADVAMVMYPLSLFHAMNAVALKVLQTIRREGTQSSMVDSMQTRAELYDYLDYHAYEARLDQLLAKAAPADKGAA